jgi:glycolate oxidase
VLCIPSLRARSRRSHTTSCARVRHCRVRRDTAAPGIAGLRKNMKDVAGYDTKRLFIGAHGAFGALTTLIFKITVKA